MIVLAIDVTAQHGSLALVEDGQVLSELALESTSGFGNLLFPALDRVLQAAGRSLRHITCFAAAAGPGTFTGVRVGLATVKGLAEATGCGALGISNLRALSVSGASDRRAAILDARRGEIYGGIYNNDLQPLAAETACPLPLFLDQIDGAELIAQDALWLKPNLSEATSVTEAPVHLAAAIAYCALLDLYAGADTNPLLLDANYVRRSDTHNIWHDR